MSQSVRFRRDLDVRKLRQVRAQFHHRTRKFTDHTACTQVKVGHYGFSQAGLYFDFPKKCRFSVLALRIECYVLTFWQQIDCLDLLADRRGNMSFATNRRDD